jgi:hypothetical protein
MSGKQAGSAVVPGAHLVIFAKDFERLGEGGVIGLVRQAQLKAALRAAGWCCLTVFVNAETGLVRISVEKRGRDRGMKLTIMRSGWGSKVLQMRDLTVREPGFARDFMSIDLSDSRTGCRVVHENLDDAIASMAARICEDSPEVSAALVQFALESAAAGEGIGVGGQP